MSVSFSQLHFGSFGDAFVNATLYIRTNFDSGDAEIIASGYCTVHS